MGEAFRWPVGGLPPEEVIDITLSGCLRLPSDIEFNLHKMGRLMWFETVGGSRNSPVECITVPANERLRFTLSKAISKNTKFSLIGLLNASYTRFGQVLLTSSDGLTFATPYVFTDAVYYVNLTGCVFIEAQ